MDRSARPGLQIHKKQHQTTALNPYGRIKTNFREPTDPILNYRPIKKRQARKAQKETFAEAPDIEFVTCPGCEVRR